MLQNLSPDKRKETAWKKKIRELRHDPWNGHKAQLERYKACPEYGLESRINIPCFARFKATGITGIYFVDNVNINAHSINACTKQSCHDKFGVDMYDKKYGFKRSCYFVVDTPEQAKQMYEDRLEGKGNHVILLAPLYDFRWHKWGEYVGTAYADHCCEYFSEDQARLGIDTPVYSMTIYKIA